MRNVKRLLPMFVLLIAVLMLGSGCSNKGWQATDAGMKVAAAPLKCPDGIEEGDRCGAVAVTPFDWSGSEKISIVFTAYQGDGNCTLTNKRTGEVVPAKCGVDIIAVKSQNDRLTASTSTINTLINSGTQLKVADINRDGRIKAAKEAEGDTWIIAPSANAGSSSFSQGGSSLVLNENNSAALSQQSTGVGVDVKNETGGSCTTGNCQ